MLKVLHKPNHVKHIHLLNIQSTRFSRLEVILYEINNDDEIGKVMCIKKYVCVN